MEIYLSADKSFWFQRMLPNRLMSLPALTVYILVKSQVLLLFQGKSDWCFKVALPLIYESNINLLLLTSWLPVQRPLKKKRKAWLSSAQMAVHKSWIANLQKGDWMFKLCAKWSPLQRKGCRHVTHPHYNNPAINLLQHIKPNILWF